MRKKEYESENVLESDPDQKHNLSPHVWTLDASKSSCIRTRALVIGLMEEQRLNKKLLP